MAVDKAQESCSDNLLGTEIVENLKHCSAFRSRIVGPFDAITMDFRRDRFTIRTDAEGKCTGLEIS